MGFILVAVRNEQREKYIDDIIKGAKVPCAAHFDEAIGIGGVFNTGLSLVRRLGFAGMPPSLLKCS